MKSIIIAVLVIFSSVLCVNTSFSQVVQKQADKWQLINGVKLKPGIKINSFIRTKATSAKSITSQDVNATLKKRNKVVKPPKILKYGNQRLSNNIRKEDE